MNVKTSATLFNGIHKFAKHIVLSSLAICLVGCGGQKPYSSTTGDVAVKIPVIKKGEFTLDVVQLLGIQDLFELQGTFAKFFFSPKIEQGQMSGTLARARFMEAGGVQIPADQLSAEMAAIYYHMQNLAQLDNQIGAKGINSWPRSIGVLATVIEKDGSERKNNAMYDGMSDSITIVPYTNQDIPVSVNPGVLAHEHFHSLFFKMVMKPLVEAKVIPSLALVSMHGLENSELKIPGSLNVDADQVDDQITLEGSDDLRSVYHWFFLKSLNEGLADVWGWAYTGLPDFVAFSIPELKTIRTLNSQKTDGYFGKIRTKEDLLENNVRPSMDYENGVLDLPRTRDILVSNHAYNLGVLYSRFFKALADDEMRVQQTNDQFSTQAVTSRTDVLKTIVKILPMINQKMRGLSASEYFDPLSVLEMVAEADSNLSKERCEFIVGYLTKSLLGSESQAKYSCVTTDAKVKLQKIVEADQ